MGRASRWLRGLLGGKKVDAGEPPGELKDRRRWGFGKSFREKERPLSLPQQRRGGESPRPPSPGRCQERKGSAMCSEAATGLVAVEDSEEQSKRAIVVATATAAAAEAAVATAQAAAVVVRLTSRGRAMVGLAGGKREGWAAVKIQSAFRGYLARRALKALRGLVKLQALVRGNIVRKQAAETLRCMQALVRVQARARTCRALHSAQRRSANGSCGRADCGQGVRPFASMPDESCIIKRNSSKNSGIDMVDCIAGWNWLDRWMEERYWEARRGEKKGGASSASMNDAKILKVDPGKPQPVHNHKRSGHHHNSCSTLASDHNSRSFTTIHDSPSKDSSTAALQSAPSPSSVDVESSLSLFSAFADHPSYMGGTASSKARLRSHSAPRQRPADYDKSGSAKRSSGAFYQTSTLQAKFANRAYPGSGRLDRLGMPLRA